MENIRIAAWTIFFTIVISALFVQYGKMRIMKEFEWIGASLCLIDSILFFCIVKAGQNDYAEPYYMIGFFTVGIGFFIQKAWDYFEL